MTDRLHQLAASADLPDGAIPVDAALVVGYLAPDGQQAFALCTAGETPTSSVIGLLAMASHTLLHHNDPTPCEQDDDL